MALSGYSVQAPSASKLLRFRKPLPGCLFAAEPWFFGYPARPDRRSKFTAVQSGPAEPICHFRSKTAVFGKKYSLARQSHLVRIALILLFYGIQKNVCRCYAADGVAIAL